MDLLGLRFRAVLLLINKLYPAPSGSKARPTNPALEELKRQVLPYLQLTRITKRLHDKPRGYAGDFLTIQWMYANKPGGRCALGQALDRCSVDEPAARAVRNRRALLQREIENCLRRNPGRKVRVTSLACGPASEVFDVLAQPAIADRLELTLVDMDDGALAYVRARLAREFPHRAASVTLVRRNLVHVCAGRDPLDLPPQDLMYSIGLIDYFSDRTVQRLMAWMRSALAPRGACILGNFHTSNPSRGYMDALLDWRLVHRDEADMARIAQAAGYAAAPTYSYEPAGVNMFVSVPANVESEAESEAALASTVHMYTAGAPAVMQAEDVSIPSIIDVYTGAAAAAPLEPEAAAESSTSSFYTA
ncbi:hypothetical protein JKP88DRAFT_179159 [Tribonema minus]|uniref:Methyltransferase domain-containing protein n=1 Tax=Tribonema minus TaxID=303371 RepID=A0A836CIB1_9STRA|nr:hypothetical protein JKP88DRAFT_179159 [Tribonema minus]